MNFIHEPRSDILIYPSQQPFVMQALGDDVRPLGNAYMAVRRNLRSCQILRHFDHPVPHIITDQNYDWPIEPGKRPLPHQKNYANFSVLHPRMFNLGDPGTMKTLSTLWAADWLMSQYPAGEMRALIIAPLTILETVWAAGIYRNFLGRRSFEILHGTPEKRMKLLANKADFSIINFDGVKVGAHTRKRLELDGFCKELAARKDINLIIIDEASGYSDATTGRHRISRLVFGDRPYIWQLTGTPTPNAPTDAYGLAKLSNNAFGKSFTTFQSESMLKVSQFKWVAQKDGYEKARRLLSPSIRYDIREVWDGPEMTTQQRQVELTEQQKKLLAELKRDMMVTLKSGTPISAVNEASLRTKFLQIVSGAVYDENHQAHSTDAKPRLDEIRDIIAGTKNRVLIFASLTSIVDLIYRELAKPKDAKKAILCSVINGNVPAAKRPAIIDEFASNPDRKVMICDPQATAHGINGFVVADTVIWATPTDKAELFIQGNKRAHRPGQKYPVTVYELVATQTEKEIFKRLETNTSLQGALLDSIRRGEL